MLTKLFIRMFLGICVFEDLWKETEGLMGERV